MSRINFWSLWRNQWGRPVGDFLRVVILADYLVITLHGVVWEYEAIFDTKYYIINSKVK